MRLVLFIMVLSSFAYAQQDFGYLKAQDQKYFKNDSFEGNNKWERIDMNVKEINKLHGEVAALKAQLQQLQKDVDELKKK